MSRVRQFLGLWIMLIAYVAIPFAFYLASTWLDRLLGLPPVIPESLNVFAAAFALLAGLFWVSWAYSYLHFVGRGSPVEVFGIALYPTRRLVTTGPYAYTRNPMVLGVLFILAAIAFIADSTAGLILVPVLALLAMVYIKRWEEPGLTRRFAEAYVEYCKAAPALIPSRKPYAPAGE